MKTLFLLLMISFAGVVSAQTQEFMIMDFSMLPQIPTGFDWNNDAEIDFDVRFRISDMSDVARIKILLGATDGFADVKNITLPVVTEEGVKKIQVGTTTYPLEEYTKFILSLKVKEYQAYNVATFFVEDENGVVSSKLYFRK